MEQQKKNKKHIQISLAIIMLLCFAVLIFVVGTSVATLGGVAAIESLRIGDEVATRNSITGLVEYQPVKHVYVHSVDELTHLTLDNGETITTTPNHPFYVQNNGYINAEDLRAGDILVTVNGDKVVVEQISHEILESPVLVYNLEVGDNHNFFVGTTSSILVHNKCGTKFSSDIIEGKSHGSAPHKAAIDSKAHELASTGKYKKIYLNKALKTAGLNGNQRPDIIAIRNNGKVELWEFASKSQAKGTSGLKLLEAKINTMISNNPNATKKFVPWEKIVKLFGGD